jgi:DNA repair exonuclease SbcCD nuclease subunit
LPTFIHTADWQIGRQFSTFPEEDAVPLAEARLASVDRLAQLAVSHRVDAVLVAGDVFDAQTVSERTIRQMFNAMSGFSGHWVLMPGNHDAALAESVWTRAQRLGVVHDRVHLALQPEPLALVDVGLVVLPAPLVQRHTFDDATAWFDAAATPAELVRVGLAHGSVQGLLAEGIDSPNPIAPDRAHRARLDYLALGDWHGCRPIDARTWYSGTPEPDRFKSNGAGQALKVVVQAPGSLPEVTPLPTARHVWLAWERTLHVATDLDALLHELRELPAQAVLSLTLSGQLDLAGHQRLQGALGEASARARHLGVDQASLLLSPTDEDIAQLQADGYLAEVIAELREAQSASGAGSPGTGQPVHREALGILAGLLSQRTGASA